MIAVKTLQGCYALFIKRVDKGKNYVESSSIYKLCTYVYVPIYRPYINWGTRVY